MKSLKSLTLVLLCAAISLAQSTPINGSRSLYFVNDTTTGTIQYYLATGNGSPSSTVVTSTPTDALSSVVGICDNFCGTSGIAWIANYGLQKCSFDNATVANDTVTIGTGGSCHDTGSRTAAGVAIVQSTNASAGTYQVVWTGASTASTGGSPGTPGTNGTNGTNGSPGVGVPTGGSMGQALVKNSATNYDTSWLTISGGLPAGWSVTGSGTSQLVATPGAFAAGTTNLDPVNGVSTPKVVIPGAPGGSYVKADGTVGTPNGAAQVQTDWNASSGLGVLLNKPTIPSGPAQVGAEPANANIQAHIPRTDNPHTVTKAQVGLGTVDNTSDALKPPSTAQAIVNAAVAENTAALPGKPTAVLSVDGTAAANSDANVPSQKAMVTYVAAHAGGASSNDPLLGSASPSATVPPTQSAVQTYVGINIGAAAASLGITPCSLKTYGAVCNGSTDDRAAFVAAEAACTNIAVPAGTGACKIGSNITLNSAYWFFNSAGSPVSGIGTIAPASGAVVTMNVQPEASPVQIFSGAGTFTLNNTSTAYPEWWGPTGNSSNYTDQGPFNAAVTALASGTIQLTKASYYGQGFAINKGSISVTGNSYFGTTISTNSATANIMTLGGGGGGCASGGIQGNVLSAFMLSRSVTATSGYNLGLVGTCFVDVVDIQSSNGYSNFYFLHADGANVRRTLAYGGTNGYEMAGQTASLRIGNGAYAGNMTGKGFWFHGGGIQDFFCNDCETATSNYGFYIDGTAGAGLLASDMHLVSTINDQCNNSCIYVTSMAGYRSSLEIVDGWQSARGASPAIDVVNSSGVAIKGGQICTSSTTAPVVRFTSSSASIDGALIEGTTQSFVGVINSSDFAVRGNTIMGNPGGSSSPAISIAGSSNGVVTGNTISGSFGATAYTAFNSGVSLDSTSARNIVYPNSINATYVTGTYSDSGTGNITSSGVNPFQPTFTIDPALATSTTLYVSTLPALTPALIETLPATCAGSTWSSIQAASASSTFTVSKNGTTVCTGTIAAAGTTVSWGAGSATTFTSADTIQVVFSGDATLRGALTLMGNHN